MALRPEADRWRLWQIALQVTLEPAQPAGVHDGNPASGTFVAAALAFGAALSGEDELFERYTGLVETRLATP